MITSISGIASRQKGPIRRLAIARIVLALGWIAIFAGLPMNLMSVQILGSTSTYSTWASITSPFWLLFTPIFLGLAAGTSAGLLSRTARPLLLWVCRIATVVLFCEEALFMGWLGWCWLVTTRPSQGPPATDCIGLPLFTVGSLLVGLSAWIRPVRARVEGKNGEQNTASGVNPDSSTGGS